MPPEDKSLTAPLAYDRLFKRPPEGVPMDIPGERERAGARDRFRGDPAGTSAPAPTLSPRDQALIDALILGIAKLGRNVNWTAALPAHNAPGYWSNNIDESARYSLPATAGDFTTVLSYKAPPSRYGLVNGYGFDVDGSFTYDGSIAWRFVLNGTPVPSLVNILNHRGSMVQPSETFIVVPMDQTLQFQVKRVTAAGGASLVDMKFKGWDWLLRKNAEGVKASILAF